MTKREFAVSKGLAKDGRGRFSKAALAAIAEAEAAGTVFDSEPAKAEKKDEASEGASEDAPGPHS